MISFKLNKKHYYLETLLNQSELTENSWYLMQVMILRIGSIDMKIEEQEEPLKLFFE